VSDDFGFTTFEPLVGDTFTFAAEGGAVELQLTAAESRGISYADVPAGVLRFKGPVEPLLPQATYAVTHAELGEFPLFVVPVGRDPETTTYEAVFG